MKRYDNILFDLDGTLTDPSIGITNSVIHALKKFGIAVSDRRELYKFIGPPLLDSFQKYYGFDRAQAEKAVEYYREHFRDIGIFENRVYDGIEAMLSALKADGRRLIVATSKPEVFAKRIFDHFGLSAYLDVIAGAELDGTRTVKSEVIEYALELAGIEDKSTAVMVGDREHDIIGARTVGIDSIGVLYGFGSRAELEAAGAVYVTESVDSLRSALLQ